MSRNCVVAAINEHDAEIGNMTLTGLTATDLSAGYEYKFKIVAVNIVGDSSPSIETAIIAATLPGAPG